VTSRASPHGLSLAEAIMAIFVLLSGVVVMTRLFHTGLRYQSLVENQSIASMLAERQMERIRGWSRNYHLAQPFTDWTLCPGLGAPFTDPDFPNFQITVAAVAHSIYSPCSLFETLEDPSDRRQISASVQRVSVQVQWGNGLRHDVVSLVAMPTGEPAATNPVTVTVGGSSTIPLGAVRPVTVTAINSYGNPIPDLFYNYAVRPGPGDTGGGFGSVDSKRDGRSCVLRHCIYDGDATPNITGYGVGICTLNALANYRGRMIQGSSAALEMQP
jgi:hypothetical protein